MINKETKDKYIEIINVLADERVASSFREFLLTYEADGEDKLHLFVANLINLLISYRELKIKAGGYDRYLESNELTELQIENIKGRFESLSRGELPNMPVSGPQSNVVQ